MGKTHDENKDLRSLTRIGSVNYGSKQIIVPKGTIIGIKMWGKLDYLTKYCGWYFSWSNKVVKKSVIPFEYRETKKEYHKLKNKKHDSE